MRESTGHRLKHLVRRALHKVYPWTAINGLDRKLRAYLPESRGVFIEAGANDGIRQSNTYYFEKRGKWTGLLVEPVPRLASKCRKVRQRSVVVETVLVAPEDDGSWIEILDLDLMTTVSKQATNLVNVEEHAATAEHVQGITRSPLVVKGRTLSSVIDSAGIGTAIDLLTLDVEGSELNVLKGLDLTRHRPRYLLIETRQPQALSQYLLGYYELVEALSHHDYLYRAVALGAL